jgi:hypothetical protein
VTVAVDRLPGTPYLLAGLPYATDDGERVRRTAEGEVTSAGALRLTHPEADGVDHFDARADRTQEEAAFALAADPRGYGNPDLGWSHLVTSTALEAEPAPGAPENLHVFAVRYGARRHAAGRHGSTGPFAPAFAQDGPGLTVRTEVFTAVIGEAAGDAHGEPELTLQAV